jgi:hypothetical protein
LHLIEAMPNNGNFSEIRAVSRHLFFANSGGILNLHATGDVPCRLFCSLFQDFLTSYGVLAEAHFGHILVGFVRFPRLEV